MPVSRVIAKYMEPPKWVSGKARHEGGILILEDLKDYAIQSKKDMVFALAGVRTPEDAVAFANLYGLLWHGKDATMWRESFAAWQEEASTLTNLTRLHALLQAGVAGKRAAIEELWTIFEPTILRPMFEEPADSDEALLVQASVALVAYVNAKMAGTEEGITAATQWQDGRPGEFRSIVWPKHLLGAIYHEFSMLINQKWQVLVCPECGRTFIPVDARQRYCSPACANRARVKRFANRKREATAAVDSGNAGGDNRR